MITVRSYRDDGPLANWLARKVPAGRAPRAGAHPLAWLSPPLVRALEYSWLVALTAVREPAALPIAFALLCVLAFHHYDTAYRLRHQGLAPPAWLGAVGGGWEGRMLVASLLALAGLLGPGLAVAAVGLAVVYAGESGASWIRFGRGRTAVPWEDDVEDLQ